MTRHPFLHMLSINREPLAAHQDLSASLAFPAAPHGALASALVMEGVVLRGSKAAARVGALGSIVVLARQFMLVNGRGRRPQRLREIG